MSSHPPNSNTAPTEARLDQVDALLRAHSSDAVDTIPQDCASAVRREIIRRSAHGIEPIAWKRLLIGIGLPAAAAIALFVALWSPISPIAPQRSDSVVSQISQDIESRVADVRQSIVSPASQLREQMEAERRAILERSRRMAENVFGKLPVPVRVTIGS